MDPLPPEERHRLRMQRKNGFIDAAIALAPHSPVGAPTLAAHGVRGRGAPRWVPRR